MLKGFTESQDSGIVDEDGEKWFSDLAALLLIPTGILKLPLVQDLPEDTLFQLIQRVPPVGICKLHREY